jgi:hypothetical protein
MTTAWAAQYIGDPWVAGEHDCWAFARRVWRERFGWNVPAVDVDALSKLAISRAFDAHPEKLNWESIAEPTDGAGVLMGKSNRAAHVGVWTSADGGGIVHCVVGAGVVFSTISGLRQMGWRVLGMYRRNA